MSRPMRTLACVLSAALPFVVCLAGRSADGDDEAARTREGLDAFRAYLKKEYPDKKWQQGPSRLDSPALRAAYGNQRFYVVYSSPPLPPGANIKDVQDAYRRQVEDIRTNYLSLTVRVDDKGRVAPLLKPEDYDGGLMKVAGDEDARTAAATILSLLGCDHVAPAAVESKDVAVTRTDKGWSCQSNGKGSFQGTVIFDADGKCTAVAKSYFGPYPP